MKKLKFTGKLNLNKETVTNLNTNEMSAVNGGVGIFTLGQCMTRLGCQSHYTSKCIGCECDSCPSPGAL